ncbi:MAG: putative nucleic-acid-binding protein contains domain [Sporomusa sp.]|jgi:predicted nucleic-acid-binding protein|nr:putative nucleic-acid-binding protein contains domain [Sporomusa sp.]
MNIIDANIILRYLLNDNDNLTAKATDIIENIYIYIPNEILVEVVYVLEKVYKAERTAIYDAIIELLTYDNIEVADKNLIEVALNLYKTRKFDIVDTLLFAYHKVSNHTIYTFDEKLEKYIIKL